MQINLLPWREQERGRKKLRFGFISLAVFILALAILLILHMYYRHLINTQMKRNNYLQTVIDMENANIASLKKEKQKLQIIGDELSFIVGLRDNSYDAVRVLDELVRLLPEGVALTTVTREGRRVTIVGLARSDLQVTQFMENIVKSKIFFQPVLTNISTHIEKDRPGEERQFQIDVDQKVYSP